eukprot:CAMPEP_0184740780 /NCGR_PEP_ID=MMETSP0315-20130426/3797_1 /TAXON_ID=101924 /ORGANISM="Rhodosorus marinus, Strain UTEX LB 2760" /LENGTH=237 /DNA_ID=CAMNT_0027210673 /DNA_START=175 /DNA_END=888 /DNA_ORIENTATION=-
MAADIGRMTGMSERMDAKDWVKVKGHLKDVYSLLAGACILGTVGAVLEMQYAHAMPFMHTVAVILTLAGVFGVNGIFGMKYRKLSFAALSFGMGFGLGPLLDHAAALNPLIVVYALVGTFAIFSSLTASAMMAPDARYLYLGGMLSSALSMLFWINMVSMFFPSQFNYNLQLYGGLMVFCGYVLSDTSRMIEKAKDGRADAISDATGLFINLIGVLRRILIILSKNEDDSKRSRRRN